MPVKIAAEDGLVHELHKIESFTLGFGRQALQRVRAHLIGH
jgi:hypothetical protein